MINIPGLYEWRRTYAEYSHWYWICNFKAKQCTSFIYDSSPRNSCLHSTFSKTGNKYVLLSYFLALKNRTAVSIVQFVFWRLCAPSQGFFFLLLWIPALFTFVSLSGEGKVTQIPCMFCLLHLCQTCLTLCHSTGKCLEDADKNSPGTDKNPLGSEAPNQCWWPYTPCWSTLSRTRWCLDWDTWCSSQGQCFCLAAKLSCISRIHSPIFPSSTWLHINFIQYVVYTELLPICIS